MSDVLLTSIFDGGEINIDGLNVEMTPSALETAVYISLFGGNEDDTGIVGDKNQWFGNYYDTRVERAYRAETGHLIKRAESLVSGLLRRIEKTAVKDLTWLIDTGICSKIEAEATKQNETAADLYIYIDVVDSTRFKTKIQFTVT